MNDLQARAKASSGGLRPGQEGLQRRA